MNGWLALVLIIGMICATALLLVVLSTREE